MGALQNPHFRLEPAEFRVTTISTIMKQRSPAVIFVATVAVMCMVLMYVSHDENTSAEEDVKLSFRSTASFDFVKALTFFTSPPRGASELLIYLKGVEANLSAEKAKRKAVMTSIRARIARNMVLAKAARDKMQKTLNAKIAKCEACTRRHGRTDASCAGTVCRVCTESQCAQPSEQQEHRQD